MFSFSSAASIFSELASAVESAAPAVGRAFGVGSAQSQQVQTGIDTAKQVASALSSADSAAQSGSTFARIEADVGTALTVLGAAPLPVEIAGPIRIASMVLPIAQSAISILTARPVVPQASNATG